MNTQNWTMPEVGIGTFVVVDSNPDFKHPSFGIVVATYPRAVSIYIVTENDYGIMTDCLHVSDPGLETVEKILRQTPHRGVWDLAPVEKERREATREIRTLREEMERLKATQHEFAVQVNHVQQSVTDVRNNQPARRGRPPKVRDTDPVPN